MARETSLVYHATVAPLSPDKELLAVFSVNHDLEEFRSHLGLSWELKSHAPLPTSMAPVFRNVPPERAAQRSARHDIPHPIYFVSNILCSTVY